MTETESAHADLLKALAEVKRHLADGDVVAAGAAALTLTVAVERCQAAGTQMDAVGIRDASALLAEGEPLLFATMKRLNGQLSAAGSFRRAAAAYDER